MHSHLLLAQKRQHVVASGQHPTLHPMGLSYSIKKLRPWKRSAKTSRIGSRKSGTVSLEAGHLAKGEVSSTVARFVESESAAFQANSRVSEGLRNVL